SERDEAAISGVATLSLDEEIEETLTQARDLRAPIDLEVFPLSKKAGAAFPDRITIGRTSNNDIVIADSSVSRLHAYFRRTQSGWLVADAGSKNGSWLRGVKLDPRREQAIVSRAVLRVGEVEVTFYAAADL